MTETKAPIELRDDGAIAWIDPRELTKRLVEGIMLVDLPKYYYARTATNVSAWESIHFLKVCNVLRVVDGKLVEIR